MTFHAVNKSESGHVDFFIEEFNTKYSILVFCEHELVYLLVFFY